MKFFTHAFVAVAFYCAGDLMRPHITGAQDRLPACPKCDAFLTRTALPGGEIQQSARLAREWGGEAEVTLADGSRVDILTDSHAWEVEWAPKWKSGPGQATLYALLSGREPGVVLLLTPGQDEKRYVLRCAAVCGKLGIAFRTVSLGRGR